jgi:hypothetical protein
MIVEMIDEFFGRVIAFRIAVNAAEQHDDRPFEQMTALVVERRDPFAHVRRDQREQDVHAHHAAGDREQLRHESTP